MRSKKLVMAIDYHPVCVSVCNFVFRVTFHSEN